MNDWTIIRRSLSSRVLSTWLTSLSVGVAVALMLVLLMMRDSGRRAFERGSGNMHLLISAESDPLSSVLNSIFYAGAPRRAVAWTKFEQLPRLAPFEFLIPIQTGDSFQGLPVLGSTPEFFSKFKPDPEQGWRLREGRFFEREFELVVGARAAAATGLAIGDRVPLTHGMPRRRGEENLPAPHVHDEFKFEVVGILEPTGSAHDRAIFTDINGSWIIHARDLREAAEIEAAKKRGEVHVHDHEAEDAITPADLRPDEKPVTAIYARVASRPGSDASAAIPATFSRLRADPSIQVAQPAQEISRLFAIVGNVDQILLALAVVVFLSSGVSILLSMYNSMDQRRRQVAVLRVLGATRGRIFRLVLGESLILGLIGAVFGLLMALVGTHVVALEMRARLGLVLEPALTPTLGALVLGGAIVLAGVAGLIPAVAAYRTSVARNLRPLG